MERVNVWKVEDDNYIKSLKFNPFDYVRTYDNDMALGEVQVVFRYCIYIKEWTVACYLATNYHKPITKKLLQELASEMYEYLTTK